MMQRFEAVGIPEKKLRGLLEKVKKEGQIFETGPRHITLIWEGQSGAGLVVLMEKGGELLGVTPYYTKAKELDCDLVGTFEDKSELWEGGVEVEVHLDGDFLYPLAIEVPDYWRIKDQLPPPSSPLSVKLSLLGEDFHFCKTQEEYIEAMEEEYLEEGFSLDLPGVLPVGLFEEEEEVYREVTDEEIELEMGGVKTSTLFLSGYIKSVVEKENELTGEKFLKTRVESYGRTFAILLNPSRKENIEKSSIIYGFFGAVGRIRF